MRPTSLTDEQLLALAHKARQNAYTPYSGFAVGAALLTDDGEVFTGCNIENAAYSSTVCAERVAFFKAVSAGKRAFSAIAIVGGKAGESTALCPPCGVCRQVMAEFCGGDFRVILEGAQYTLADLLPQSFALGDA